MRPIHPFLLEYVSNRLQIGNRAPNQAVFLYHPATGERMRLERVRSIDLDVKWDAPAGSFQIEADNRDGWLSPDFAAWKWDDFSRIDRGDPYHNPWTRVIWPNTKIEIWLGYGSENDLLKQMTGLIDSVSINAASRTISIKGRSLYKKLLVETPDLKDPTFIYKNTTVKDIIVDFHHRVGVPIEAEPILILDTPDVYDIAEFTIERGKTFGSYIQDLVLSSYTFIGSDPDGKTILKPIRDYDQNDPIDHVLDEAVNITELEYSIDDMDVNANIIIKSGDVIEPFESVWLRNSVANGQFREEVIDLPWANTKEKRKMAAVTHFRRTKQRMRQISISTVGHPALELFDICRVKEMISTATANYAIKGIRTSFTEQGYFDFLDLEIL